MKLLLEKERENVSYIIVGYLKCHFHTNTHTMKKHRDRFLH